MGKQGAVARTWAERCSLSLGNFVSPAALKLLTTGYPEDGCRDGISESPAPPRKQGTYSGWELVLQRKFIQAPKSDHMPAQVSWSRPVEEF